MKSQACEPCAKRKVRCDRAEPSCSNCKRRKHDHCVYPEISPADRIKHLEEIVRSLGGDPSSDQPQSNKRLKTTSTTTTTTTTTTTPDKEPSSYDSTENLNADTPVVIREDDGRSVYLEFGGWQEWTRSTRSLGISSRRSGINTLSNTHASSLYTPGRHLPHAFQGCPWRQSLHAPPPAFPGAASLGVKCPIPALDATRLWDKFVQRVEPTAKISFEWTMRRLREALTDSEQWPRLCRGEQLQILATCLFGAVSLSNDECVREFGASKSSLLSEYRGLVEYAFTSINILVIDNIATLKALCLYLMAGFDIVTLCSLWSLMGLLTRSAEQLGIHRDGQLLGLSPVETEERRRLWWQLQHLDLFFSVKGGVTPMTFTADWDAKLPLNIEDCDLIVTSTAPDTPTDTSPPKERTGLTSLSYNLFVYWIIGQQRKLRQDARTNQLSTCPPVDRSLLSPLGDSMIRNLETQLNQKFLQYCDPIKPLHALIQVTARTVICVLRLRGLHEARLRLGAEHLDNSIQDEYYNTCMQSLEYSNAFMSHPLLSPYQWMAENSFAWHAFIGVLIEMTKLDNVAKIESTWSLLTHLYDVTPFLLQLSEDRRRVHAANYVVATWNACQQKPLTMAKPAFVSALEERLSKLEKDEGDEAGGRDVLAAKESSSSGVDGQQSDLDLPDAGAWQVRGDLGAELLDFNFEEVDWSFWDSLS